MPSRQVSRAALPLTLTLTLALALTLTLTLTLALTRYKETGSKIRRVLAAADGAIAKYGAGDLTQTQP